MPIRERCIDPPIDHGKYLLKVPLNLGSLVLQCVHIVSKCEITRDINRVTHEIFLHINRGALSHRLIPPLLQPLCHLHESRKEGLQVRSIQGLHGGPSLPEPLIALR